MAELRVGECAPDFRLLATSGEVCLSAQRGKRGIVLYFYPKDNTPG